MANADGLGPTVTQAADSRDRASALAPRVTFGIVTALSHEYAAMTAMLDVPVPYRASGRGAAHDYELGEIPARGGGTHVVAVVLGDQGNSNAATYATALLQDFPEIEALLMVGIAGGVPSPTKPETHVRLGDIVVSGECGVVKYDFVKELAGERVEVARHPPRPPSAILRQAARRLLASEPVRRPWVEHMGRAAHLQAPRPSPDMDRLADSQDPAQWVVHPDDERRRPDEPRVFEGTIGAADRLQKNRVRRDQLRDQFGVRAIEMEGFGVAEATHVAAADFFIVRGICDYCDSHKADHWQNYAAIAAAGYARAVLEEVSIRPTGVSARKEPSPPSFPVEPSRDSGVAAPPGVPVSGSHHGLRVGLPDADPLVELEHQAQLDSARALLAKGHAQIALEQLEALRTRIWNGASKPIRARVLTLTGHAELELGRFESAGTSLVAALGENPADAKTLANGALGHTLLGNAAAAVTWAQKALALDATNTLARQVLIHHDGREDEEVRKEHEAVVGKRTEIFFALGQRAARKDDTARAAKWFEAAAEIDKADPDVVAAAGQSLAETILEGVAERSYEWEAPRFAEAAALRRAGELIQQAWAQLRDDEVRRSRVHWLLSLGRVRRALGERDGAIAIAEDALKIGGNEIELVRFRAAVAADTSDYGTVVRLLTGVVSDDPEIDGLLAAAQSNLGQLDAATLLWERLLARDIPPRLREQAERNRVFTLIEAGRSNDARNVLSTLSGGEPSLGRLLVAVEGAARLGDPTWRDQLLDKAMASATRDAPARVLVRLGDALMIAGRPKDAANVYEYAIVEPEAHDRDCQRLISALHRAGRFDSALAACRRVVAAGRVTRFCTEAESVILEELGDLPAARAVCERYLATEPNDATVLVRLAVILLRARDTDAFSALLERLPLTAMAADVAVGTLCIKLLHEAGREHEALEVAYELRRRHADDPSAHLLYVEHHRLLDQQGKDPTVVESGVAVRLTGSDAPKGWFLLTEDASADASGEEIRPSAPVAKALMGKRVGDTVSFDSAPHRRWQIVELSSKYVFAFRQSLAQFGRRFPQDGRLEQFAVPDDPKELIADLKVRLEQGEPLSQRVLEMYGSSGSVTVGALGSSLHRGPSESLGIALASPHGLIASANTVEEKRAASLTLGQAGTTLVADYSAISMLSELEVLDLAFAGRSVAVSQSTIDAFRQELGHWKAVPDNGYMSFGLQNGQITRYILGPEDIARRRQRYEALGQWLPAHCTVLPVAARIVEQHADKREVGKWLGQCYWDSVLLAAEQGRVLLSDDLKLRLMGQALVGATGVASVHLLLAQRAAGRIEPASCADALLKLVLAGYKHVGTDASMLESAARQEKWHPVGAFHRVLETLKGPHTEVGSAIVVAVEFFRLAWLAVILPRQRDEVCLAVIDALVAGRSRSEVLRRLGHAVGATFRLLPQGDEDMRKILKLWSLMHLT